MKKNGTPSRPDPDPTPRLLRALREPERGLIKLGTLDEAKAWSRRVYESACEQQRI